MSVTSTTEANLVEVYNLTKDTEHIRKVQRATLNTTDYGLIPEHGLFGSEEWWQAVRMGKLPTIRLEGVISRVHMGSMNDWPVFELDCAGKKSTWPRQGHPPEAYIVGKKARVDYVVQKAKKDLANLGTTDQEVILRIAIEP